MRATFVLLAGLLAAPSASAQLWVPSGGPTGGDVRALAADPRDPRALYLGTADGHVYRSDDAGGRWQRLSPGFPLRGMSLDEIVVSPDGTVYVGYWQVAGTGGGVARSTDGGRSFAILAGMQGESVRALALAAERPRVIVAGALSGVFRSDDAGESWRRVSPEGHPGLIHVESLALDPADPGAIYAGTWHLPWKTADAGSSWRPASRGIIDDSDVFTLLVDRTDRRTLYATACSGIYRSRDAGGAWSKLHGIPSSSRRTRAFAQDPDAPQTLYAGTTEGLWISRDAGTSWRLATPKTLVVNALVALPGGGLVVGADGAGVLRSADRGESFIASNQGFAERFVARLLPDGDRRRLLAAVAGDRTYGGVLSAPGPAGPWTPLGEGLQGREALSLALLGSEVVAGTDDGVYLSVSHCGLWRRLPTSVDGFDPRPRVADVATLGDRVVLAATGDGLLRSTDAGEHWQRLTLGLSRAVSAVVAAGDGRTALAATPLGLYRSQDAGQSWTLLALGVVEATVHQLLLLPGDDRVVFATTSRGLLRSTDQGMTWARRGGGLPQSDITGLALLADGRTLYASDFSLGGLYRSDDAGASWRRVATDGLPSDRVWALAADPGSAAGVLAATPSGGLHVLAAPAGGGATAAAAAAGSR